MRMLVKLVHPQGFPCELDLLEEEIKSVDTLLAKLLSRGYRPPAQEWPRTPEGEPLCSRHGAVMSQREKQGDVWHSHKVVTEHGEELYCRGYPHGPHDQDGFHH